MTVAVGGSRAGVVGLGALRQPCEKNRDASGVSCKVSSYLCSPVGGKKEVVSGSLAPAYDDGVGISG